MDPLGSLSLAQEYLRRSLADCATFRTLCEAENQAEALARIHHEGLPEPANKVEYTHAELTGHRPHAIVYTDDYDGFQRLTESGGNFAASGRLKLRLCRTCPATVGDEPTSEANLDWKNIVGRIIGELCDLAAAGANEHLAFIRIALDYGPFWNGTDLIATQGSWQGAEIGVDWTGQ